MNYPNGLNGMETKVNKVEFNYIVLVILVEHVQTIMQNIVEANQIWLPMI